MQILFTVTGDGPPRDYWLDADAAAPFGALAEVLEPVAGSGGAGGRPWWDGDRPLRPDSPIGEEVLEGAVL